MVRNDFFHMCAKGADVRNFIIREADYKPAFNYIGVCAANCKATVVSFSIEDTHPHILLCGTYGNCLKFMEMYERLYRYYAATNREKGKEKLKIHCELYPVGNDESYLLNVAAYTIIQATKDGKSVMPYDYKWGTGSMYFRCGNYTPPWYFDSNGIILPKTPFNEAGTVEKRKILHTRTYSIPGTWLICNGLILPENYIDIRLFEDIYQTFNRFRVFLSSPKQREEEMLSKMASYRGVSVDDLEAREICKSCCEKLFGSRSTSALKADERLSLARELRHQYHLSFRQLSILVRLPEAEIRSYIN